MSDVTLPLRLAPDYLSQPILPDWNVSLFSVNLGRSSDAEAERAIIDRVGSYGRQLGHLAEALEVVIDVLRVMDMDLAPHQRDTLQVFLGEVAATRELKAR